MRFLGLCSIGKKGLERYGENGFGFVFSILINGRPRGKFMGERTQTR